MANTSPDDVVQLKQELAQFLLTEITSVQGAATFRQEVAGQVGAVIDQLFAERLAPALAKMEQDHARQIREITDRIEPALRRFEEAAPDGQSAATGRQLAEIATGLNELRQRLARVEDQGRSGRLGGATAQPIRAKDSAGVEPAIAASPEPHPVGAVPWPRWVLWLLLILALLTTVGLANLYYERLAAPAPEAPRASLPPPAPVAATAPSTAAGAVTPPPQAIPAPPTNPATTPPVTPPAVPNIKPQAPPVPTPHARNIPADFAIERGWLAAQPYAVEPRLARRAGTGGTPATLRSLVCGASDVCTSDLLLNAASDAKQLIALQMLMAQIGDQFCTPRRTVAVTGQVSAGGLADLAAIAKCASGAAHLCVETLNKACPPDADSLQAGMASARTSLLRWALWKTGST